MIFDKIDETHHRAESQKEEGTRKKIWRSLLIMWSRILIWVWKCCQMTWSRRINMQWGSVSIIEPSLMKNAFSQNPCSLPPHLSLSLDLAKRLRYGELQFGCSFCYYKWASYGINFPAKRQEKSITRECLINILRYLARQSAEERERWK